MFLGKGTFVCNKVLYSPVAGLVLRNRATVDGVGIFVVDTLTREAATLGRAEVQTDVDAIAQSLNPWAFQFAEEGVVRADTLVFVEPNILVALHSLLGDDSLVVGRHGDIAFEVAVFIVRTGEWAHAQHVVHGVDTLGLTIAVVGGESESQPLAHHLVEVTTDAHTVVALCRHHCLIVVITGTEAVAAAIGTAGNADIMVMAHACLVVQVLPVGIGVVALVQRVLV